MDGASPSARNGANITPRLNILILYDDRSTHIGTIREHLEAFQKYSAHACHFMPATGPLTSGAGDASIIDLNVYDAVLLHYSVRVSLEEHISPDIARAITAYSGQKLLFIQDEYDTTETARRWIECLGIDAVFTNVPSDALDAIYPRNRFPNVGFVPTLTGYVPEDSTIESFALPIADRKILIGYRGRQLPHQYGALGYDKFRIGVEVKRLATTRGIAVDIEVDDRRRIYGLGWYRFLGSVRATLGTESGSNVFDFDGNIARLAAANANMPFSIFAERFLAQHENFVRMNQISPKIFEAIRLRTALILFEGEYSGVVHPNKHYIPLKHDFSNADEAFAKLQDLEYIESMTTRAYRDVVDSGCYSYATFVKSVDAFLDTRKLSRRRADIISVPLIAKLPKSALIQLGPGRTHCVFPSNVILDRSFTRERLLELIASEHALDVVQSPSDFRRSPSKTNGGVTFQFILRVLLSAMRPVWRFIPPAWRQNFFVWLSGLVQYDTISRPLRWVWRSLPENIRSSIPTKLR